MNIVFRIFKLCPKNIKYSDKSFFSWLYIICSVIYICGLYYLWNGENYFQWENPISVFMIVYTLFTTLMSGIFMAINDGLKALAIIVPLLGNFLLSDSIRDIRKETLMYNGAVYEIAIVSKVSKTSHWQKNATEWEIKLKSTNIGEWNYYDNTTKNTNTSFSVGDSIVVRMCESNPKLKELFIIKPNKMQIEQYQKPFVLRKGKKIFIYK